METVSLQGIITEVKPRQNELSYFTLKTPDGNTYKMVTSLFCPIQVHDVIHAPKCKSLSNGTFEVISQPFVDIPESEDKLKEYLYKTLRTSSMKFSTIEKLYVQLGYLSNQNKVTVVEFLNDVAERFNETGDKRLLELFIDKEKKLLSYASASKLLKEWYNKRFVRKLYLLGLTKTEINRSGLDFNELYKVCLQNPYRVSSIEYAKCEKILASINASSTIEDLDRLCGKVNRYVFDQTNNRNVSFVKRESLKTLFPFYETVEQKLYNEYYLSSYEDRVYLSSVLKIEVGVAEYINKLLELDREKLASSSGQGSAPSLSFANRLTEEQQNAVNGCLKHHISIVTGGAGTGKSEIVKEITNSLSRRGISYTVCSFTGKAVSKLHSVMENKDATTIDRLILDIKKEKEDITQHYIIDECSMVRTELFYRLIKAINFKAVRFTIIGDCNQLPPIGWGEFMKELISSGKVPVYKLTKNIRIENTTNSDEKTILENANALIDPNRNLRTPFEFKQGNGFYVVPGNAITVKKIVEGIKNGGFDSRSILILSPYRTFLDNLNDISQSTFIGEREIGNDSMITYHKFMKGDKVMMTRNNYSHNIMNGEEGEIVEITNDTIKARFQDIIFDFEITSEKSEDRDDDVEDAKNDGFTPLLSCDLVHSYAVSIHKSQGSEADYVILYLEEKGNNYSSFLNINLLYTAITRTKRTIWIVGEPKLLTRIAATPLVSNVGGLAAMLR